MSWPRLAGSERRRKRRKRKRKRRRRKRRWKRKRRERRRRTSGGQDEKLISKRLIVIALNSGQNNYELGREAGQWCRRGQMLQPHAITDGAYMC